MSKTSELIKTIRKEHDLSQQDLAEIMLGKGGSMQFVSLIENKRSKLPLACAKKICKKLKIDPFVFIEALSVDYKNSLIQTFYK